MRLLDERLRRLGALLATIVAVMTLTTPAATFGQTDPAEAAVAAIRSALERGDALAASDAATQATRRFPESLDVLIWAGHARRIAGDLVAASQSYRVALRLSPDNPEALMGLGSVLEAGGNPSAARETYGRVVELAPENPAPRRPLATLLMRSGDHAAAAGHLEIWVEAHPEDTEARYLLGMAHFLGGFPEQALPVFEGLLRRAPDYVPAIYALGVVLADRPESQERALELLRRALSEGWEAANAEYLIGRLEAESGDDAAAAASLERALEADPDLIDAHYQLALALNRLGQTEEARARMDRFRILQQSFNEREAADKDLKAMRNELVAELAAGDMPRALATVDRMLAAFPDRAEVLIQAAKVWLSSGDTERARDAAIAARQTDPEDWEAHYLEGLLQLRDGDTRGALSSLRRAVAGNPLFPDGHELLGNAHLASGDVTSAVESYLAAIDLDPDNPGYWLNLASAYQELGRGDLQADALATYRRLSNREDS